MVACGKTRFNKTKYDFEQFEFAHQAASIIVPQLLAKSCNVDRGFLKNKLSPRAVDHCSRSFQYIGPTFIQESSSSLQPCTTKAQQFPIYNFVNHTCSFTLIHFPCHCSNFDVGCFLPVQLVDPGSESRIQLLPTGLDLKNLKDIISRYIPDIYG